LDAQIGANCFARRASAAELSTDTNDPPVVADRDVRVVAVCRPDSRSGGRSDYEDS
jgi:hypothetical protein